MREFDQVVSSDVCDARCPAAARWRVFTRKGCLDFCGHHFKRFALVFMAAGYVWQQKGDE
jgi:hypothetical protein